MLPPSLSRVEHLPSLPSVALDVLRLAQDEDASSEELAAAIGRDPALAAKLLKLANSSLFSAGRPIATLREATMLLGSKTVKLMALSFTLTENLNSAQSSCFDYGEFWRRSLMGALASRSFARAARLPCADEAFLSALLADLGQLVMVRVLPEDYAHVLEQAAGTWPSAALEQKELGFHRGEVADALLASWALPASIRVAVQAAHASGAAGTGPVHGAQALPCAVQLGRLAVDVLCGIEKGRALERLEARAAEHFALDAQRLRDCLVALECELAEMAGLLELALPAGQSCQQILDEARDQMVALSLGTVAHLRQVETRASQLERQNQTLAVQASTDALTGLANRASFDAQLAQQLHRRMRGEAPKALGLLMIDIDRFKHFNDTWGHQNGDKVLRLVGHLLSRQVRGSDFAARYGGEEFVVILPEATPAELSMTGERLRAAIEAQPLELDGRRVVITASFGGAFVARPTNLSAGEALVQAADRSLYRAKDLGRNRVVISACPL